MSGARVALFGSDPRHVKDIISLGNNYRNQGLSDISSCRIHKNQVFRKHDQISLEEINSYSKDLWGSMYPIAIVSIPIPCFAPHFLQGEYSVIFLRLFQSFFTFFAIKFFFITKSSIICKDTLFTQVTF